MAQNADDSGQFEIDLDLSDHSPEDVAAAQEAEQAERQARYAARQAEKEKAEKVERERYAAQQRAKREKWEADARARRERAEAEAREKLAQAWVLIKFNGNTYAVHPDATPETMIGKHLDDGNPRMALRQLVERGRLFTRDDRPVWGDANERLKARLLQRYDYLPLPGEVVPQKSRRWLIPGFWKVGWFPGGFGQYKAGKTTLVCRELVPALVVPGWRFLNHFEPVDIDVLEMKIEQRGVWLINVETPIPEVEEALRAVDEAGRRDLLTVDHLENLGGAKMFDLTDPEKYDFWWHRLGDFNCEDCDGSDFTTPFIVIVDGLTEILVDAGKDVENDSAAWFVAFKRLMRSLDIPCALVVGHATMKGDHAIGGTDFLGLLDGSWKYTSDNPRQRLLQALVQRRAQNRRRADPKEPDHHGRGWPPDPASQGPERSERTAAAG